MKIWQNIRYYSETATFAFYTLLLSAYVWCHLNYLDNPEVTPFPPPPSYRIIFGFTDDWWFASLLTLASFFILIGVIFDKQKIIVPFMALLSGVYCGIAFEFILRGIFSPHYNITWNLSILIATWAFFIMKRLGKGGERNR